MSILGILNLNNEVQIRPEEQACVVQVVDFSTQSNANLQNPVPNSNSSSQ